jgi:hypothetical protein
MRPQAARPYAGIGSRSTPAEVLVLIEAIAARVARDGWVLRTGSSPGADQAFYRGALAAGGAVELYLPWPGFEASAWQRVEGSRVRLLERPSAPAYELAAIFYEPWGGRSWAELDARAKALLARDVHQVLGADLRHPVWGVVCWTPDAGLDGSDPRSQGTGQALRVAARHGIPVFNLALREHARRLRQLGLPA